MKTSEVFICLLLLSSILTSCTRKNDAYFDAGVSSDLALYRKSVINDASYIISFNIPPDRTTPISGEVILNFNLSHAMKPLMIDFRAEGESVTEVVVNTKKAEWEFRNEHIIIPQKQLKKGNNSIGISFIAGDMSLNRNEEFLYTLFVPDRACTAFPCFDQPDIKATYSLTLEVDSSWKAISNNPVISNTISGDNRKIEFSETKPISTYLFAFAAGKFKEVRRIADGIEMTMLHRETREELVDSNVDDIFNLHADAIRWLEDYTNISYPFEKFGFVLIPSFQYGGMEHPGSIFYRASSLFHEKDASINQKLSRAGLIAHETSHIWFGDLVTMKWFDDVWLKEVFAGYMADKIVNPGFPNENHDLKFLLGRYPAAYAVDRTKGANPVIQKLDNMKNAGTLYGGIIYNKAPVIMKHLEIITGEEILRVGLRKYLDEFSYANAVWEDLVNILDEMVETDLKVWSDIWVREAGMPTIISEIVPGDDSTYLHLSEYDPSGGGRHWSQELDMLIICDDTSYNMKQIISGEETEIPIPGNCLAVLPDSKGIAYGYFRIDSDAIQYLAENIFSFKDPLLRGVIWLIIWENMLNNVVTPQSVFMWVTESIRNENEPQLQSLLRGYISSIFWDYFDGTDREDKAESTEMLLLELTNEQSDPSLRKSYFNTYVNISSTGNSLGYLYNVWRGIELTDLFLSENDKTNLAFNLALKGHPLSQTILSDQLNSIENSDREERMRFIIPALSGNQEERDNFFDSLLDEEMREHEPWVSQALSYLNHPLNEDVALKYIMPGLMEMIEIQETGDIFFPEQWISSILGGHHSKDALIEVMSFLDNNPDFPANLRLKVLQSADHLYRQHIH
ncbi:MAG TPA: M1 family aminopeptidase [Bacteroidales bacterium]|nr:M1 family aminopeptidase [Bacteroidales bacterium]